MPDLIALQRPAGKRAPQSPAMDHASQVHLLVSPEKQASVLESTGRAREAVALRILEAYREMHGAGGPPGDDPTFGLRLTLQRCRSGAIS